MHSAVILSVLCLLGVVCTAAPPPSVCMLHAEGGVQLQGEGGVQLHCPHYTGKGFCCWAGGESYCCGEEEWAQYSEIQSYNNKAVKSSNEEIQAVIDDLDSIDDALDEIVESERERRRRMRRNVRSVKSWNEVYRVLLVSIMGLTLVLIFSVLCNLCTRLCNLGPTEEEEAILVKPLVQDRFKQVYSGLSS